MMKRPKIISVEAFEKYKIFAVFDDGTRGMYDLSDNAGRGVFKIWEEPGFFNKVFINPENNAIAWNDYLEIDTLNCYLTIKGISFDEYKSAKTSSDYAFR